MVVKVPSSPSLQKKNDKAVRLLVHYSLIVQYNNFKGHANSTHAKTLDFQTILVLYTRLCIGRNYGPPP